MNELEKDDAPKVPEQESTKAGEESEQIQFAQKALNKGLVSLSADASTTPRSGMSSETSSIAPEDETTLSNSGDDAKNKKAPRKLIEDEQRARGRIAWSVWKAYFGVSKLLVLASFTDCRPWAAVSGVREQAKEVAADI